MFPEGKVNQPSLNPNGGLIRFKWGMYVLYPSFYNGDTDPHFVYLTPFPPLVNNRGRILMDAESLPTIIPIWLSHFDKIMPEPRSWPRFIPRLFSPRWSSPPVRPTVTFGEPFTFSPDILSRIEAYRARRPRASSRTPLGSESSVLGTESTLGVLSVRDEIPSGLMAHRLDVSGVLKLRSDMTGELQAAMEALGRKVAPRET